MIFQNKNSDIPGNPDPLQRIHARIADDPALRLSILDAGADDDVLVVLCTEIPMIKMVKLTLQPHWPGSIEVYCPASMMTGSGPDEDVELVSKTVKSQRLHN